jgi:hypothetical protein
MKTKLTVFTLLAVAALLAIQSVNHNAFTNAGGAPAGREGSPFDFSGATCNLSGCHSSYPLGSRSGWITSNIPGAGYVPGQTYTITATASSPNRVKFGFEISPQTSAGVTAGTIIVTNTLQTRLASPPNTRWITHTLTGSSSSTSGTKGWSFDWTAPAAGTGTVTFYGAFNCANNNGNSLGDSIFTSQLVVTENTATGIATSAGEPFTFLLYPNPASTQVTIAFGLAEPQEFSINIYDAVGKRIWMAPPSSHLADKHLLTMNLEDIGIHRKGIYFMEMSKGEKSFSRRFIVL